MTVETTSSKASSAEGLFGIRIAKALLASPPRMLLGPDSSVVADILAEAVRWLKGDRGMDAGRCAC